MEKKIYQKLYEIEKSHWWFVARRKIVVNLIESIVSAHKVTPRILDIGCSVGITTGIFSRYGWTCGLDFSREALKFCNAHNGVSFIQGDARKLPVLFESCDVIVALDLLEHLQDDELALREFNRVLKQNGFVIISVPAFTILWGALDRLAHHFRRYRLKQLRDKISKNGFVVKKISYINCLLFVAVLVSRLMERVFRKGFQADADLKIPVKAVNSVLEKIFASESNLIGKFSLPFGNSIICVAQKRESLA